MLIRSLTGLVLLSVISAELVKPALGDEVSSVLPSTVREVSLSAGSEHVCAIRSTELVKCWGSNSQGQLNVPPQIGPVKQISAGNYHTCAITTDTSVKCWGQNTSGESNPPTSLTDVTQISAGYDHSCALKTDGAAVCWGDNTSGQVSIPLNFGSVLQISAGKKVTCAVLATGNFVCWGGGFVRDYAMTGAGSESVSFIDQGKGSTVCYLVHEASFCGGWTANSTMKVPDNFGAVSQLSVGFSHICALNASGGVGCWGSVNHPSATALPSDLGPVTQISAGEFFTCAVTAAAQIKCWGDSDLSLQTTVPSDLGSLLIVAELKEISLELRVDGQASVGTTMSAIVEGIETGTNLSFQWCRDGSDISAATSQSFKLLQSDYGHRILVRVTASKPGYISKTQVSSAVLVGLGQLSLTPQPTISGSGKVDSMLSAFVGDWNDGAKLTFSWLRDAVEIEGQKSLTYRVLPSDFGHRLSFKVAASISGYVSASSSSSEITVTNGELMLTPMPSLKGPNRVGATVSVEPGLWDQNVLLRYQWFRDGVQVLGQISSSYTLLPQDLGHEISVAVTGAKLRVTPVQRFSPGILIERGDMAGTLPRILGQVRVGKVVNYSQKLWANGANISYQWLLNGKTIKNSANKPLKLLTQYKGQKLSLRVTQTAIGYKTMVLTSSPVKVG